MIMLVAERQDLRVVVALLVGLLVFTDFGTYCLTVYADILGCIECRRCRLLLPMFLSVSFFVCHAASLGFGVQKND